MRRILLAAPLTLDLMDFERQVFIEEILKRTQLMMGTYDVSLNRYGIVDIDDPRTALTSDTTRPLTVSVNAADPATVDISPGTVVFPSGEVLVIESSLSRISVPGGIGTRSVVFVQFDEQEYGAKLTRFESLSNTYVDYLEETAEYIRTLTRADYDQLTSDDKSTIVPLAYVTVQEVVASGGSGTTTELVVDMTQNVLVDNRPWFSPVDVEHRSYVGTGVVSSRNPHGTSLNDISVSGSSTLFQIQLDHGMIVSKDLSLSKVPGKLCQETILEGAITLDSTGAVTGVIGAFYFRTSKYPTQLIGATNAANTQDYAPLRFVRSNLVFLLPKDQYTGSGDVIVYYMTTDAAEPPVETPLTSLTFKDVAEGETLISDGFVLDGITNPVLTFEDASPIPQEFIVYLDGDGQFQRYPQTCFCYKKLTDIGTSLFTFEQNLRGPARLKIGLQNAIPGASLDVRIQISGRDSSNNVVVETVTFGSSWVNNLSGTCSELDTQFQYTSNVFSSITSGIVTTNLNSGPDAALAIFGDVRPDQTEALADILPVALITWDGIQVCSLEDIRPISTSLNTPPLSSKFIDGARAMAEVTAVQASGYLFNFWVEDFSNPKLVTSEIKAVTSPLPALSTDMQKVFDGLDVTDTYVSRPIPVRPHNSNPTSIRFIPILPGKGFELYARWFDGSNAWSTWRAHTSMVSPLYSINISGIPKPLSKWQVVVRGQCKGLIVVYISSGDGLTEPSLVSIVDAWNSIPH